MTDPDLEREIDQAGRDLVFAIMLANGWHRGDAPPKFVWRLACQHAHALNRALSVPTDELLGQPIGSLRIPLAAPLTANQKDG